MTIPNSRRRFLRNTAAVGAAPFALNLASQEIANAQTAPDYRALVCVYLGGGNDHLSTIVPYDTGSYNNYKNKRGGLALDRATLLPLTAASAQGGRSVGLSPNMTGLKAIYDAGRCAILAGVGTLNEPTTRAKINSGLAKLPPQLGSHLDQANIWNTLGTQVPYGWGGRMGDFLAAGNGSKSNFTTVSGTGGYTSFLVGTTSSFFTVSEVGAPSIYFGTQNYQDNISGLSLQAVLTGANKRTNLLEQAYAQTHDSLLAGAADLSSSILASNTFPAPPGGGRSSIAQQLLTVARIIGGRAGLSGVKRQIFFVSMGGFDTHSGQTANHPLLMTQLSEALSYFDACLGQINARDAVTTYTQAEFGRTYAYNGDGTDHGWGSHHFIMGGAVKGGNIYGTLPEMDPNGPDFTADSQMIPTIAVEQYGATLAKWMGISDSNISTIFPNLGAFNSRDLGFMKP